MKSQVRQTGWFLCFVGMVFLIPYLPYKKHISIPLEHRNFQVDSFNHLQTNSRETGYFTTQDPLAADSISNIMTSNTGAPQGTVLAPFLLTLYTSDAMSNNETCSLVKFADDTDLLHGLISTDDDTAYVDQIDDFVTYCGRNCLELHYSLKAKEMSHFVIIANEDVDGDDDDDDDVDDNYDNSDDNCVLDRRFMPKGSMPLILLLSFPGSGNTWVRYLLERSSGIYTGSAIVM
ncbi:putative RNA-directed DNA polymerase from mobile element jockey-like [Apostichopus japonicus]|uniref:Putative RNA-directed DNA polymerase from mobile element jockey-like n=1 Tax=Stichopus japonicus TaxID=307972 RepID=A0A2G8LRH3_STIJA|nr:putative RNA-directed DNA polymerase from mobile element jockey-like [Apostichopus japonicus]